MSKRNTLSEEHIQATCTAYLEIDGWRALRTDPTSDKSRGKGFGEIGMADHLYIRYFTVAEGVCLGMCRVLWVEYKSASGKLRPEQLRWAAAERARGALVVLATVDFEPSIEGFQSWYASSGLRRNVR